MRILVLLFFAVYFCACKAQNREVNPVVINLDIADLKSKGTPLGKGAFLAINDTYAIGQIGFMDIVLFDMRSGDVVKSIDTDRVLDSFEDHIHKLQGKRYYIPNKEENLKRSRFVGVLAYDYRGLHFVEEKGKFAVLSYITIFNKREELDQQIFPALVLFDEYLDGIEIVPFDPLKKSTNSDWSNGGFILGQDRIFTKMMAWKHDHDFDFIEYRLIGDSIYAVSDTLFGIKVDTIGYPTRLHGCFAFNDKHYLNLGTTLYAFEGDKIKEGNIVQFPNQGEHNYLHFVPLDENRVVTYVINNYRFDPNPTGWLLIKDNDFTTTDVLDKFDLREAEFCSLFVNGTDVFVVNYDRENEQYYFLKYGIL